MSNTVVLIKKEKSAAALRTIGEVAEALGVAQHVLRFWENKFNQIKPQKRRGRRYYRPEDVEVIRQIQHLLYKEGYTIKGVQKYLNSKDVKEQTDNQPDLFAVANPLVAVTPAPEERGDEDTAKKQGVSQIRLTSEDTAALKDVLNTLYKSRDLLSRVLTTD